MNGSSVCQDMEDRNFYNLDDLKPDNNFNVAKQNSKSEARLSHYESAIASFAKSTDAGEADYRSMISEFHVQPLTHLQPGAWEFLENSPSSPSNIADYG